MNPFSCTIMILLLSLLLQGCTSRQVALFCLRLSRSLCVLLSIAKGWRHYQGSSSFSITGAAAVLMMESRRSFLYAVCIDWRAPRSPHRHQPSDIVTHPLSQQPTSQLAHSICPISLAYTEIYMWMEPEWFTHMHTARKFHIATCLFDQTSVRSSISL